MKFWENSFQGDASPITPEEIENICVKMKVEDLARELSQVLELAQTIITLGIDYGARADLEQLADPDRVKAARTII